MPGGRGESFTKLHTAWIAELVASGASKGEWAVFCMIAQFQEPGPRGTVRAWRPVKEMAAASGMSESAVMRAARGLREKGLIRPIGKAHRGKAQQYELMPGVEAGKSCAAMADHSLPKIGKCGTPNVRNARPRSAAKIGQGGTPNRREEPASPALRREGREEPMDRRRELRERLEGYGLR